MLAPIALLVSFLLATVTNPVQSVVCIYDEVTSIQAVTSNKSVLGATVSGEPSGHAAVIVDDVVDIAQAVKGETSTMIPLGAELIYFSRREVSPTGVLSCLPRDCQHAFQLGPTMICPTQVDVHKLDANKVARLVDYMDIKSAFLKWSWVLDTTLVGRVVFGNFCVTKSSEYNITQLYPVLLASVFGYSRDTLPAAEQLSGTGKRHCFLDHNNITCACINLHS
ncbi:hypothetical protein BKA83DRAFT_4128122 [Pisolithus microcarpus]|nr:hypothetical protein BKA83DRAFT_4128122 [Pisolithus microcarpus]